MSAHRSLLRIEDVRPRCWELAAFVVSLIVVALSAVVLRIQPDYVLAVEDPAPGRLIVLTSMGPLDLAVGDAVVVAPERVDLESAGTGATVTALDGATVTIQLDHTADLGAGRIVVRAPARPALAALVGRILR